MQVVDQPVRVLISYAHDDHIHEERVRRLWMLLRAEGIDARLDVTATAQRQFWPNWMSEQIRAAQYVLVVASPQYRVRAEDRGDRSVGKGVRWEARQLMERWYADPEEGLRSILPVVLPGGDASDLPDWLLPGGGTVYRIEDFTPGGVEALVRVLTDQPLDEEPPVQPVRHLPPRAAPGISEVAPPDATGVGGLCTEVLIDARLTGSTLVCEVSLAGTVVCRQEAVLPAEVRTVWQSLPAGAPVAHDRMASTGRALTAAVFNPAGQELVADLVARLRPQDEVDIIWRADGGALAVPVELLTLTTGDGENLGPLALIGGVGVRRQVRDVGTMPDEVRLPGPLRVLAAVAAPDESRTPNAALDVEAEMQALLDAVGDLAAGPAGEVRILEVASLAQIAAGLRGGGFHVLHLSAHGSSSSVELEDEDGNPHVVGCRDLMNAIRDAQVAVPLIVLSSCAGAAGGGEALAAALVEAGADRVLAMQTAVTDRYATELLAAFYRELVAPPQASGSGSGCRPAAGLARARRAVERARRSDGRVHLPEYGVATLVCAGTDRPLMDPDLPPLPLTAVAVPSGTSVRELGLGQLIGRRRQLREGTAVLRRTAKAREEHGAISGVQLIGVGGIGKTAVAGRLATRARGDGMVPVLHEGRWNPSALFAALAVTAGGSVADVFAAPEVPDKVKTQTVRTLLTSIPLLLVFDDFEQNLTPGGDQFVDPAFDELFTGWCDAAEVGAILVTCRYPLPGDDRYLVPIPVGPLSPAELRRLLLRLPALRGLTGEDLRLLTRTIGGHPRLIEYVDALLRGRPARFRQVQSKLRDLARQEGIDLRRPRPLGDAVEDALLLGSADILLDELLSLLTDHERAVLRQLAVSRAPMTLDDLAYALTATPEAEAEPVPAAQLAAEVERLADLTLLAPRDDILVHPWTAELLERRSDGDRRGPHERALKMRIRRVHQGRTGYDDFIDIPRHLAATDQYGQIPALARQVVAVLPGVLAASAYLAEVRPLIPRTEPAWTSIAKEEYEAVRSAGDLRSARSVLNEVRETVEQQIEADPRDVIAVGHMSVLLVDLGDLAVATGDLRTARDNYQAALHTGARLPAATRGQSWWRHRPSIVHSRLGNIAVAAGDMNTAREHYQASLDVVQQLADADPGNADWQRDVSVSHNKLGDVAVAAGDMTTAREHYQAGLDIRLLLVGADPGNSQWQRDVSVSRERLGGIAVAAGNINAAREHYQASLDIRLRLAETDRGNTRWQSDVSISHNKLGDVALAAGDMNAAQQHYQASLDIRQRLADADRGNTHWQRDVSVSRDSLGRIAAAMGDLNAAREHYRAGLAIAQRLAASDPGNTEWQRDVSVSMDSLGDVALATGDMDTAREHFLASLEIRRRLVDADPGNTLWQRDLSVSHDNLGEIAAATGDLEGSRAHHQAGHDIAQRLATADPANTGWQRDLSVSFERLGEVAVWAGDINAARDHYQAGLDIAQRLAATDPRNSMWQRDLVRITAELRRLDDLPQR